MASNDQRTELIKYVANLEEQAVLDLVHLRLAQGDDPLKIVEQCQEGMQQVGQRYERGEYYLAGLIMAGEIFREVTDIVQPLLENRIEQQATGKILLGTVQGDIHDMGKNILAMLLRCYGFTVIDLGVDIPASEFVKQTKNHTPDIVGISALLTSAHETLHETVTCLRDERKQSGTRFSIVIGGGQIDAHVCMTTGADHYGEDAMAGVRLCQRLMAERNLLR